MSVDAKLLSNFKATSNNEVIVDKNLINKLNKIIKNEKRVAHSISVAELSYRIALSNHLEEPFLYYLAGLFHDLAKGLNKEELMKYMNQYYKEYLDLPLFSFHQFVGAKLTKEYFGINNETILDAIMFHCTGKDNMSSMAMIIYAADKTDPLRGYDSSKMIESMMNNYFDGFKYVLNENRLFLINKTHDLSSIENRLSKACFEYYLDKK